jgi:hypothetical protein
MFPFLASALLTLRRNPITELVEPAETEGRVPRLVLVPPPSIPVPMMSGDPTPLSNSLVAMLAVLKGYAPTFVEPPPPPGPPPPPALPPAAVFLTSVVERTVGLGSRVGTDTRGPFSVAALRGLRVEAVVRFEIWRRTPAEVGQAVGDLITNLLGDRDALRVEGFLRVSLKNTGSSENVFAEEAWRQNVEFDVLFEFPYRDSDGAESLIARIPIDMTGEFTETTTVVDEMTRWDQEDAFPLALRGPLNIGALTALAFIAGLAPTGQVTITRTFDDAPGLPTNHPALPSFLAAVTGDNPAQRHANVTFVSLVEFLRALASFKITDEALDGMRNDLTLPLLTPAVLAALQGIKDLEVGGEDVFVALLEATIGVPDTATFKSKILKHAAILKTMILGDWDENSIPDEYESVQLTINPSIRLTGAVDRFEITFEHPALDKVAVVYLRATRGPTP